MKLAFLLQENDDMVSMYHVTPRRNLRSIMKNGLQPKIDKRGIYAHDNDPAIYLFVDQDTAEDAVMNWLGDEYEDIPISLLGVIVNKNTITDDPEIAGSYITKTAIPPEHIKIIIRDW